MGIFELMFLSLGVAMDAFAVSISKGLSVEKASLKNCLTCGIWFGFFQGLMPLIGFLVGSRFEALINMVAPWVAFILLSFIGINMIREAFDEDEEAGSDFSFKTMLVMAIATSIDALAVGITFVAVPVHVLNAGVMTNTIFAVVLIGLTTFVTSTLGVKLGNVFGARYRSGSEVMGGTILVFIGLKALLESLDTTGAMQNGDILFGMLIPFAGTVLGAACIYLRFKLTDTLRSLLAGISAGIMFSISVWCLLEPAFRGFDKAVAPIAISFFAGVVLQYLLDQFIPHMHTFMDITEGPESHLQIDIKVMLAEIIHHIPEGIALGAIYAGYCLKTDWISASAAIVLAIALAIQNFPEALFVSLPVKNRGTGTGKAFFFGVVSGVPVPLMGVITLLITVLFSNVLPYVMSLAAGAMLFATVEEIPQISINKDNDKGTLAFICSFAIVMIMVFAGR